MTFSHAFRSSAMLCALLPIALCAQSTGKVQAQNSKILTGFKSSPINTESLPIQIDESYRYMPKRPENPVDYSRRIGSPNKLVAGGLLKDGLGILKGHFPAIDATGWTPPDPDIAVGPNHILAVVNSSIAWFDKSGTKLFQQTAETFFSGLGAGTFQFDPKCFYDRVNQRYVLLFLERGTSPQVSKLLIAVSDDNNPAGTWHRYRLEAFLTISGQPYWLDYPGFGYNKDAIVVTGNMFPFGSGAFGGAQFIVIPTAPLLTGSAATLTSIRDAGSGSVQVAEMISPTAANVYAVSRNNSTSMRVFTINNPGGAATLQSTTVTVPSNSGPTMTAASTNGNSLDTIDSRVFNATWRDGRLVAAHNIQSGSFVGTRWYQINTNGYPSSAPTLGQSGNITSTQLHQFMPAISTNAYGDISTIFTGSSSTVTANLLYAGRTVADAAGAMGLPQLLENSANTNYTSGRWGDYFGVDVDPVDDIHFWGIGMSVNANNGWRTSIYRWRVAPVLKALTFSPNPVLTGQVVTMTVELTSPAPAGGVTVAINPVTKGLQLPATLFIPEGSVSASAPINTANTSRKSVYTIEAVANGRSISTNLNIRFS